MTKHLVSALCLFGLTMPSFAGLDGCPVHLTEFSRELESRAIARLNDPGDKSLWKKMERLMTQFGSDRLELDQMLDGQGHVLDLALSPERVSERRAQDARWFAKWGWRRDSTNPYTRQLRSQLEMVRTREKGSEILGAFFETSGLRWLLADKLDKLSTEERLTLGNLLKRGNQIAYRFLDSAAYSKNGLAKDVEKLKEDLETFKHHQLLGFADGPIDSVWRNRLADLSQKFDRHTRREVKEVLGRDMAFTQQLEAIARRSHATVSQTAALFETIDGLGNLKRARPGIYDVFVAGLVHITVESGAHANTVVDTFFDIDNRGALRPSHPGWTINDAAVVLLTEQVIKRGRPTQEMVDKFYAMVTSWKTIEPTFVMADRDLARLAILSLEFDQSSDEIFQRYLTTFRLANANPKQRMGDPAVIDLIELSLLQEVSPAAIYAQFADFHAAQVQDGVSLSPVAQMLLLRSALKLDVRPVQAGELVKIARDVDPSASDAQLLWMITQSIEAKRSMGHAEAPGRDELYLAAQLLSYPSVDMAHWMRWGMEHKTIQRSRYNRSSSSRSSSDDFFSPTQAVLTGNWINIDGNPFTPF